MNISMYQASILPLMHSLSNLVHILEKGQAYAEAKNIEPEALINFRLYPDMFPLKKQVYFASYISTKGAAKLAGLEPPIIEDNQTSFVELIDMTNNSISYLKTFKPEQIDGRESKTIEVNFRGNTLTFEGLSYLMYVTIPDFYFHVITTYDILRHCGVEVGKTDFLGTKESLDNFLART
ncbi:MAG: DUF1993 domain-containing protein [Moorea sp. SIO2B7]|nr:DUF1993 domain-containing protein [Moorena sp. SIO2B7]